jgi:hypothetical protein
VAVTGAGTSDICVDFETAAGATATPPRPWKTTSSELEETSERAGDGLRIAICAIASVLSWDEEGEEGAGDSLSEVGSAGSATSGRSLIVPSSCPALTNWMGMCRSFLPAS